MIQRRMRDFLWARQRLVSPAGTRQTCVIMAAALNRKTKNNSTTARESESIEMKHEKST